jgi:hypothetical protein
MPGEYQVRLRVGELALTRQFKIVPDPRVAAKREDFRAQFELLLALRDRLSETHATANRIAALRAGLQPRRNESEVAERADAIDHQLAEIDQELIERSPGLSYAHPIRLNAKLAALGAMVASADAAPTQQSHEVFADLSDHLAAQLERLHAVETQIAELNAELRALHV